MTILKQGLAKNLSLVSAILIMSGLFGFFLTTDQALAASTQNLRVRQVKTSTSPTVYYLDYTRGLKKAYTSASAFLSYGNKWSDVKIISQEQLNKWADAKLIKLAGEKDIYYIKGNKKALVKSPADFSSLGLGYGKVVQVNKNDFLSYQTTDYAGVGLLVLDGKDKVKSGGGNPGLLTVTLDSNSQSGFLPMNSRRNLVAVYNLRAGGSTVAIRILTLNVLGVFHSEVIEKIYLTSDADYTLGEPTGLSNRLAMFNFGGDSFVIPAGETKKIRVYVDLKSYADFTNHSLRISLNNPGSIQANKEISGDFPLIGGEYKFAVGSLMGAVKAEELALNTDSNLIIGSNEKIIGKLKISETSSKENAVIKKITLVNLGSARSADLANFKLKDSSNHLLAQAAAMDNDTVIFNLNNYILGKGLDTTLLFLADIIGGENRTINFNLSDFYAIGATYGYGLTASQVDSNEAYTIVRETLSILSMDFTPSRLTYAKQNGVIIGNFQLRNNNQKVKLANLNVSLEKSANAPALNETVYLVNYQTGEIYSSTDGSRLLNGASFIFNNLILEPRQVLSFSLITNLPALGQSGDRYRVVLNKISYHYDNNLFFEDSPAFYGNYLTVSKSSLYAYTNNVEWDRNFIKGQKNIKIASFIIEAAAGADLNIDQITLASSQDTSGAVLFENGFSNLRLSIGGSRVGSVIDRPTASTLIFDNYRLRFGAGGRAEIALVADTERDLKASEIQLVIFSIGAKSLASNIPAAISGLNSTSRKVYFGDSQAEIKMINGGSFIAGTNNNNVGRFSVANNGAEDIRLNKLTLITSSDGFSNSLGFSNLTISEAVSARGIGAVSRPVAGANEIGLGGYIIKPSQTVEFIIRVSADDLARTNGFEIFISDIVARGAKSGLDVDLQGDPTAKASVNFTSSAAENGASSVTENPVLAWSVSSRTINYGFHDPSYPFRATGQHDGIDIDTDQGTPVKAAANGVAVEVIDSQSNQYSYVVIEHAGGLKTTYGHLSAINIHLNDLVTSGQIIGLSGGLPGSIGSGANTNGPHLHFGVSQNGTYVNPVGFLN